MLGFSSHFEFTTPVLPSGGYGKCYSWFIRPEIGAFRAQDAPEFTKAVRLFRGIPWQDTFTGHDPRYRQDTLKAGPAKDRPWDPPGFLNADSNAPEGREHIGKSGAGWHS